MKLYNTLTKKKEEFVPLQEGKVTMYVCGPTVYNFIHIGNARPMIVFDTVRRYMEYKGYEVNFVSNFTDVDDKIIKKQLRYEYADTILSMVIGWAINSAMILLAAAAFFGTGTPVTELEQANSLLAPLLGNNASVIFAVALLFAGISSTITSGMAAGSIFAGIYKEPYDIKDSHSRIGVLTSLIIAFALIMVVSNPFQGLIYSQMALSVQLPITIFTQVYLTSSSKVMGKYKNSTYTKWLLYVIGGIVTLLNVMLLISFL